MKTKVDKKFQLYLEKFAPKKPFMKLVRYTKWNGYAIKENTKVKASSIYTMGHTIIKDKDGYNFFSRTITTGIEQLNSLAEFDNDFEFVKGNFKWMGMMTDWDGRYHKEIFNEVIRNYDKIDWDVVVE